MTEENRDPEDWLREAVSAYGDALLRLCFLYLGDRQMAEDAVQECFIKAYRSRGRFRGSCSDKTWLTRIAVNQCKSMLRRKKPTVPLDALPEAVCEQEFADSSVIDAVLSLPRKGREVILLYYYQEMSIKEIARLLHLAEGSVSARLSRARADLKEKLKGWYWDESDEKIHG